MSVKEKSLLASVVVAGLVVAACYISAERRFPTDARTLDTVRIRFQVLGAVKQPGMFELPPDSSDVFSAIAAAGGLAENAGTRVKILSPVPSPAPSRASVSDQGQLDTPDSPVRST